MEDLPEYLVSSTISPRDIDTYLRVSFDSAGVPTQGHLLAGVEHANANPAVTRLGQGKERQDHA